MDCYTQETLGILDRSELGLSDYLGSTCYDNCDNLGIYTMVIVDCQTI